MIYTLVLQIFALEKIKSAMHIVFIFFYIVVVLVVAALLGKGFAPYVLIPALFIQYFVAVGINDMFILHDKFLYECETFEGKDLETYLFHNNLSAIDLTEKTKTQEVVLFGISVAMFTILVFGKLAEGFFNPLINILVVVFYLSIMLCYFTLGLFRNDVFYAFLGFKDYLADQKRLLRSVLLIFLISMGLGLLISSNNSPEPVFKLSSAVFAAFALVVISSSHSINVSSVSGVASFKFFCASAKSSVVSVISFSASLSQLYLSTNPGIDFSKIAIS